MLLAEVVNNESTGGVGINEYIYTYEDGRLTRMDYAATSSYSGYDTYRYDEDRLEEIQHWVYDWSDRSPQNDGITVCTSDSRGHILNQEDQNRTITYSSRIHTYAYDAQGRCIHEQTGWQGSGTIEDIYYTYDNSGNLIAEQWHRNGEAQGGFSYQYGSDGTLVSWTAENLPTGNQTFQVTFSREESGRILQRKDWNAQAGQEITVNYFYQ